MTLNEFCAESGKLASLQDFDSFLVAHLQEIRPLFYGRTQMELHASRFEYETAFLQFNNSPTGKELGLSEDPPTSAVALLIFFLSLFERAGLYAKIQSVFNLMPTGSYRCQAQALFRYKHITDARNDYENRFDEILGNLSQAYDQPGASTNTQCCCQKIVCEYALESLVKTQAVGIDIHETMRSLFLSPITQKKYTILSSSRGELDVIFNSSSADQSKLLDAVKMQITGLFHREACELHPPLLVVDDSVDATSVSQSQEFTSLPPFLDDILLMMGARYEPNFRTVQVGVAADDSRNKAYLGSYFPRTVLENWNITHELFGNSEIKEAFLKKKVIRILDVGSGTGGAVVGFLLAINSDADISNSTQVVIHSVDANEDALNKQTYLIAQLLPHLRFSVAHSTETVEFPHQLNKFSVSFSNFLDQRASDSYDLVLFWKCLCEFYNQDYVHAIGVIQQVVKEVEIERYAAEQNLLQGSMSCWFCWPNLRWILGQAILCKCRASA